MLAINDETRNSTMNRDGRYDIIYVICFYVNLEIIIVFSVVSLLESVNSGRLFAPVGIELD